MGHMTEQEIEALQATKLDRETPFVICGVSLSQLSIARFYGGCKFQGRNYSYIPTTDELLRLAMKAHNAKVSGAGTASAGLPG